MTVYTILPKSDENLAVTLTEDSDLVTLNITPVVFSGAGGITSITAGSGLSGGTITTSGTIAIDSTVATLTGAQALSNKTGNISQWSNDSGYTTNTGTVTASSTDTFTNKSGSNSQWTNDEGYTTNTGTVTPSSSDTFTNKAGNISQWTNDSGYGTGSTTINDNADDRIITGSGTANTLNGEANFTWDGSKGLISGSATDLTTPVLQLTTDNSGWDKPQMMFTDSNDDVFSMVGRNNTSADMYQWNITLDPNNTNGRSGVTTYAGDYFVAFEKDYSTPTAVAMNMQVYGANDGFKLKVFDDFNSGGGNQYGKKPFIVESLNMIVEADGTEALKVEDTGITFYDEYTFPTADGSPSQTLQTNGSGVITWATGGGGATDLDSLTDVDITSVANNDLLMYNSVASKWQNTNLGVTVTPTLTGSATGDELLSYTFTVSNHATYDDPAYFVEVYTGVTKVVDNDDVTDNLDGTLTFTAPATGTHEIRVRCQDFGDLQSEIATKALTTVAFGDNFRYWKITGVTCSQGNWWMLANWRMYTAASQGGTAYPSNMTSNALPTPFVAATNNNYNATYPEWHAFDSNTTGTFYWAIGSSDGPADWITIDLGAAVDVKSLSITAGNGATYAPTGFELYGSATGSFGGEETLVYTASGLPSVVGQVTNIG